METKDLQKALFSNKRRSQQPEKVKKKKSVDWSTPKVNKAGSARRGEKREDRQGKTRAKTKKITGTLRLPPPIFGCTVGRARFTVRVWGCVCVCERGCTSSRRLVQLIFVLFLVSVLALVFLHVFVFFCLCLRLCLCL